MPFTSGFLAKFYVISAAVKQGQYPLAIIAMLAAAVAAFFYLRVALLMYSPDPAEGSGRAGHPRVTAGRSMTAPSWPGSNRSHPWMAVRRRPAGCRCSGCQLGCPGCRSVCPGRRCLRLAGVSAAGASAEGVSAGAPGATAAASSVPVAASATPAAAPAATVATLEAPPSGPIPIPIFVGVVLAVCVAFTIFAGVSSPIITLARQATMLF